MVRCIQVSGETITLRVITVETPLDGAEPEPASSRTGDSSPANAKEFSTLPGRRKSGEYARYATFPKDPLLDSFEF